MPGTITASTLRQMKCHGAQYVLVAGSFQTNGTSAVSLTKGSGFTVARSGVGVFDITFTNAYKEVVSATCGFQHATDIKSKVMWDALSSSAKTAQLRTQSEVTTAQVQATGTITVHDTSNTTDGDTIVIDDGIRPPITFEFDKTGDQVSWDGRATATVTCDTKANSTEADVITLVDGLGTAVNFELDGVGGAADGVTAGNIVVDVSGDTSASDISATLQTAIAAQSLLGITAVDAGGSVTLTQDAPGVQGNHNFNVLTGTFGNAWAITEFTGGREPNTVAVDLSTVADTTTAVSAALTAAINNADIGITAVDADPDVTLTSNLYGAQANKTITETFTGTTNWAVTGMTGGVYSTEGLMAAADTTTGRVHFNVVFRKGDLST